MSVIVIIVLFGFNSISYHHITYYIIIKLMLVTIHYEDECESFSFVSLHACMQRMGKCETKETLSIADTEMKWCFVSSGFFVLRALFHFFFIELNYLRNILLIAREFVFDAFITWWCIVREIPTENKFVGDFRIIVEVSHRKRRKRQEICSKPWRNFPPCWAQ